MKVNLEYESIDADGEKTKAKTMALMDEISTGYKLTFVEDLSGEGRKTRSTMYVSSTGFRLIRQGELNTDFMFGPDLLHNTLYGTPYGTLPVVISTKSFSYNGRNEQYIFTIKVSYTLQIEGQEPTPMEIAVKVKGI